MAANLNLSVIERFVASVLSGDSTVLQSLCHPDFMLHEGAGLSFAGAYQGSGGFLEFLSIFNETLDIRKLDTVRTYTGDNPDYIICEIELDATVRATGKVFTTSLLERWHFQDGKVIEIKPHYFDAM